MDEKIEMILKNIESQGVGKCSSYNIEEEVALINDKKSKLSSSQREKVLFIHRELKKGK